MTKHYHFAIMCLLGVVIMTSSCKKQNPTVPPQPRIEQTVNSGQCPDCNLWTCTDRTHDICTTCGISRRGPRGCLCNTNGEIQQPGNMDNEPVPQGTPPGAILVRPDKDIVLSPQIPVQTRTFYLNCDGFWQQSIGILKISYDSPISQYLTLPEHTDNETFIFTYPQKISVPTSGVTGNYRINGIIVGRIRIHP